ncbi:MAG: SprT family zinc-dependent metalloprotease [Methylococcales bacterium]|nr:SprT family zinc-dependent metalloprotease [Methylococcales bacterium]
MITAIELNDIVVDVTHKKIKNIHLSVYPNGQVKLSAPLHMNQETLRSFLISKLDWIKQKQSKFQNKQRETPRDCINRENHYVWGRRYLLTVIEHDAPPKIVLGHSELLLYIRAESSQDYKQTVIDEWLRQELKKALPPLLEKWQSIMGVQVKKFFIQKMKTRWGSCNYTQGNVRFNSELVKKPPECLEYVVVHELAHLLEPSHNARFHSLMSQFMPNWKLIKVELNRLPIADFKIPIS